MSLLDAFSALGAAGPVRPTYEAIAEHIRKTYLGTETSPDAKIQPTNPHRKRRRQAAEWLRFYRDEYIEDVNTLVELIYEHPRNKEERKKVAELAMAMNVTARIVNEISPVYDKPAVRRFADTVKDAQFRMLEAQLELHDLLQEAHRLTTLLNEILLWSATSPVSGDRSLRIITPDSFDVVPDPRNRLVVAGVLLDTEPVVFGAGVDIARMQHFELWDDTNLIRLDQAGRIIGDPEPHNLGRIPGLLVHRRKPTDALLDQHSGRDIIGAHKAIVFFHLCVLRLAKAQGENQPVLRGILARVAAGQPFDGETPVALPPEVTLEMLNSKTDPDHFLLAIRHWVGSVAQRYGMSYEQVTFQETTDSTSGRAYQVRREKLTEIRQQQKKRWARVERDLMDLLGLGSDGFSVDFAELAVPQDATEEVALLDAKMRLGLDNPVAYIQRKNPDLDANEATAELRKNLTITQKVWDMARAMQTPAAADTQNPGKTAAQNGAQGGQPAQSGDGQMGGANAA